MTPLWDYFWPLFVAGILIGAVTGHWAYRQLRLGSRERVTGETELARDWRRTRRKTLAGGAAAAVVATLLWHVPLGAGDRLAATIESGARAELERQEMHGVSAKLERRPLLRRQLILAGPADDFQQSELVRILDALPGVASVRWTTPPTPSDGVTK